MSTFWIDDLQKLSELLTELNSRMGIKVDNDYFTEESATVNLDFNRKDSNWAVMVISAEKSAGTNGSGWTKRVTLEWNMDYQTVDEIVYDLQRLLGIK